MSHSSSREASWSSTAPLLKGNPPATTSRICSSPATLSLKSCGDLRMANVVLLGALLRAFPLVGNQAVMSALEKHMPSRHRDLLAANAAALERGGEAAESQPATVQA